MIAKRTPSVGSPSPLAVPLTIALCLLLPFGARATEKKGKNAQPMTGRIEIATQPGGYPLTIDGQPAGETTDYVRAIEIEPGPHTVEIEFPNNTRWSQVFNIVVGRKSCIALNYRPRTIEIPALPGTPAAESQNGLAATAPSGPTPSQGVGKVETVDLGDVTGTVCDCGEIPPASISKVPWWKRAAGKLKPK